MFRHPLLMEWFKARYVEPSLKSEDTTQPIATQQNSWPGSK
jgi:hypothetical protein